MATPAQPGVPKLLLIDSNVFFAKRLADALKREGFDVMHATQSAYALTMIEWNPPLAILCATNMREMGAYELPPILHADIKTAHIPIIAVGDGGDQALMEAFRAGCEDYVDRRNGPDQIAAHIKQFLRSHDEGFQPTPPLQNRHRTTYLDDSDAPWPASRSGVTIGCCYRLAGGHACRCKIASSRSEKSTRRSNAPLTERALSASASEVVSMMMRASGNWPRMAISVSVPFAPGSRRSIRVTSGRCWRNSASASFASTACATRSMSGCDAMTVLSPSRNTG